MRPHLLLLIQVCSVLAMVALLVAPAAALTRASTGLDLMGPGAFNCSFSDGSSIGASVSSAITHVTCPAGGASGAYNVSGSADAGYGTLRAEARVGYSNVSESGYYMNSQADARASFRDDITLDVAGRTGEVVDLVFHAAMSGVSSAHITSTVGTQWAKGSGALRVTVAGEQIDIIDTFNTNGFFFQYDDGPKTVQITLGQTFEISALLSAGAEINGVSTFSDVTVYDGSAIAPFGASGGPTAFELFGMDGTPISDFTLSSGSGKFAFYVVPEPGTGALLVLGMMGMGFLGKRRSYLPQSPCRHATTCRRSERPILQTLPRS